MKWCEPQANNINRNCPDWRKRWSPVCTPDITMSIQSKINVSSAPLVARKKTSKKLKRFQWFSDWGREIWLIVASWAWIEGRWSYFWRTLPLKLLLVSMVVRQTVLTVRLSDQNNMFFPQTTFSPSLSTSLGPQGKAFDAFLQDINVCSFTLLVVVTIQSWCLE